MIKAGPFNGYAIIFDTSVKLPKMEKNMKSEEAQYLGQQPNRPNHLTSNVNMPTPQYIANESNIRSPKRRDLESNLTNVTHIMSPNSSGMVEMDVNNQGQRISNITPTGNGYLPSQLGMYATHPLQMHSSMPTSNIPSFAQQQIPPPQQDIRLQPHRERVRVSKACDRCRSQKIKCLGTRPCNTCIKHKKECAYTSNFNSQSQNQMQNPNNDLKRRKVEYPPFESFGVPVVNKNNKEYVNHLENRIQYLESILSDNSDTIFRHLDIKEADQDIDKLLVSPSSKWRYLRRHQNLLLVELCQSMYSSLSEESKKNVQIPRTQYFGWNMSGCHYLSSEKLPPLPKINLPLDTKFYIDYYFREINPLYGIIHENVFREQIDAYEKLNKENRDDNQKDPKTNQTKLFSAILYLIYSLSIRFIELLKPDVSLELLKIEEKLFKYAYQVVSNLSFQWESFELIQCWLLISLYLRITHRQPSSYHAFGNAITITRSMGLGHDHPKLVVATPYEKLKAKRVFWAVYTFDKMLGLQTGRYGALGSHECKRPFPSFDFKEESKRDDWITLPAFALIHIAKISNYVHTTSNDNPDLIKYQQMNKELKVVFDWLNSNGFDNEKMFSTSEADNNPGSYISPLVRSQVKLHFYDLMVGIHGKLLFNFVGRKISNEGLKIGLLLEALTGIIDIYNRTKEAGLLFTPWYFVLILIFNCGVSALTMINSGVFTNEAKFILRNSIQLFNYLKDSPVKNSKGKVVIPVRFNMVKECLWALKMGNHILSLRLEEDRKTLKDIGIDHGSSEVNKQTFIELGFNKEVTGSKDSENNEFSELLEKQLHRTEDSISNSKFDDIPEEVKVPTNNSDFPNEEKPLTDENLIGNLQWFDQWLDFDYNY